MYCMNCGKRLEKTEKNAKFCPACGKPLPEAAQKPGTARPAPVGALVFSAAAAVFMAAALWSAGAARLSAASPGARALFAIFAALDLVVLRFLLPHQK